MSLRVLRTGAPPRSAGRRGGGRWPWALLAWLVTILVSAPGAAAPAATPTSTVAVIVDTSVSMAEPGMDPQRSSLLVTKLLADIVPGDLAVIRLLDTGRDRNLIPWRPSGEQHGQCETDGNGPCQIVIPTGDWPQLARQGRLGALVRRSQGDPGFKRLLDAHLAQVSHNSMFSLALRAAQGVFDQTGKGGGDAARPRTLIWLSDGRSEARDAVIEACRELSAAGVPIEAIVFGAGDPRLARDAGLNPRTVTTPAEIMQAFAEAFRTIVRAPYAIDAEIRKSPEFDMKPGVAEAWVVVYGDDSLQSARISGPGLDRRAEDAADRWPGAGAYRVARVLDPPPGRYRVSAEGGGPRVAYAVIQRLDAAPTLLEPRTAFAGEPTLVLAELRSAAGQAVQGGETLAGLRFVFSTPDRELVLNDEGRDGDTRAQDGRYSGTLVFPRLGTVPVVLKATGPLVAAEVRATVEVSGALALGREPLEIDLGTLRTADESCRPLPLQPTEHRGGAPLRLELLRSLPAGHRLTLILPAGELAPDGPAVTYAVGDAARVCLRTSARAAASVAEGETWLKLVPPGAEATGQSVRLHWRVEGLTFLQRWLWLILSILGAAVLAFVVLGFIVPKRLPPTMSLLFAAERDELEELTPYPINRWKGVGIGFYRDARAYLHADFRLSGSSAGALACLLAVPGGVRLLPVGGEVCRETLEGAWVPIPPDGERARPGDTYRAAVGGPYFRLTRLGGAG